MKTVCVVRYGAIGDNIMITPALRLLKQDGYRVVLNCHKRAAEVFENNPYIDEIMLHDEKIPNNQLEQHWASMEKNYDKFINLSGSIEQGLLPAEGRDAAYSWPQEVRQRDLNVNYYDRTNELCGYPEVKGLNGELYFSRQEEEWGRQLIEQYKNRFWVLWSLSGSAFHKTYPFAEQVAMEFLKRHQDAMTMTIGDDTCRLLEWDHPQNKKRCGAWNDSLRKSLLATKLADCVVSTETGIANAAGCFDTPKIIMLSHSSVENLTKYWKNCVNLLPLAAPCYPCHQLHYTLKSCPVDVIAKIPVEMRSEENHVTGDVQAPVCTARLTPEMLLEALEAQYVKWRSHKHDDTNQESVAA